MRKLEFVQTRGWLRHVVTVMVVPAVDPEHGVVSQKAIARRDLQAHLQQLRRVREGKNGKPSVEVESFLQYFALPEPGRLDLLQSLVDERLRILSQSQ